MTAILPGYEHSVGIAVSLSHLSAEGVLRFALAASQSTGEHPPIDTILVKDTTLLDIAPMVNELGVAVAFDTRDSAKSSPLHPADYAGANALLYTDQQRMPAGESVSDAGIAPVLQVNQSSPQVPMSKERVFSLLSSAAKLDEPGRGAVVALGTRGQMSTIREGLNVRHGDVPLARQPGLYFYDVRTPIPADMGGSSIHAVVEIAPSAEDSSYEELVERTLAEAVPLVQDVYESRQFLEQYAKLLLLRYTIERTSQMTNNSKREPQNGRAVA